ncbi:hypothetical protein CYMTET_36592 [Cymbomonas tetramitiformis]|uniref:Endonuclease/exonuclease/phosphatase domain-containing protein n=1 Tax=Cymbomonas tetramitiformis TaxID=36881 RepID=A0AAE0CFP1_9CHLO|nr:hypothetical protein CYMTET_36592 [Cymbomonas tetramitiformis]
MTVKSTAHEGGKLGAAREGASPNQRGGCAHRKITGEPTGQTGEKRRPDSSEIRSSGTRQEVDHAQRRWDSAKSQVSVAARTENLLERGFSAPHIKKEKTSAGETPASRESRKAGESISSKQVSDKAGALSLPIIVSEYAYQEPTTRLDCSSRTTQYRRVLQGASKCLAECVIGPRNMHQDDRNCGWLTATGGICCSRLNPGGPSRGAKKGARLKVSIHNYLTAAKHLGAHPSLFEILNRAATENLESVEGGPHRGTGSNRERHGGINSHHVRSEQGAGQGIEIQMIGSSRYDLNTGLVNITSAALLQLLTTKGCQQDTDSEIRDSEIRERGTEEGNEGEEQGAERTDKETTRQEKVAQSKSTDQVGGNQPTPYRGKIYQTEPRDEGSDREDSLNMLTWNIGGRRDAGYDMCHMLEQRRERPEEDVHVIVLTEVKTAHRDMMNKFRDMGYTAVGTEVANAQERKGAEQTRARGGVVTLLGGPYGHVHNH